MRKLCRAVARGTQSDERALVYGFGAIVLSVVLLSLLRFSVTL
jgi:hypothetical protein